MRFLIALFAVLAVGFVVHEARAVEVPTQAEFQSLADEVDALRRRVDALEAADDPAPEPEPEPEPDPTPDQDQEPAPPPPPGDVFANIQAQPAGTWARYGQPWADLEASGALDRYRDNCGHDLPGILGAWNGGVWDVRYFWMWAPGGHADGCFNGILRYDLEAGVADLVMPHTALNVPWTRSLAVNATEPYVADVPWPLGMESPTTELWGTQILPRSSHYYTNTARIGDHIYLATGSIYKSGKADWQFWRFNINDPVNTIERLPDRPTKLGNVISWVQRPGLPTLAFGQTEVCELDPVSGALSCMSSGITLSGAKGQVVWDEDRQGIWVIDTQYGHLKFAREQAGGTWKWDESLTTADARLDKRVMGYPGLCLVPTDQGANPVLWGADARLWRYDGTSLTEITGQVDQPAVGHSAIINKWTWNQETGACLLLQSWNDGLRAWKPDFSSRQEAGNDPPPPDPEPAPGAWPTFAGHVVAPAGYPLAAWDEPVALQPEAPDVAALCPGPWADLHYRTEGDLDGSRLEVKALAQAGTPNVRVYVHGETFTGGVDLSFSQCGEVVGVPSEPGARVTVGGNVSGGSVGVIVRGLVLSGKPTGFSGTVAANTYSKFIVLHDNEIRTTRSVWGVSDPFAPLTYLEFVGNIFGPDPGWHVVYLERSIGKLVARGNVFHGANGHALKNLAHQSWIEGNVFSNVGIDGQVAGQDNQGRDVIGLFPLDAYACTETIIRNNTFVFRTANFVRAFFAYRGRRAWGNCDKGARRADGETWDWLSAESAEYHDPAIWAAVEAALPAFEAGFEAARAEPWLFAHKVEGNTFIVFNALTGVDDTRAAEVDSLRPVARNPTRDALAAEARARATLCEDAPDRAACWLDGASDELRYAYDHISPDDQTGAVRAGVLPRGVPIQPPSGWRERAGVFWGRQTFITCDAAGADCAVTGERPVDAAPRPWDPVEVADPPRLYRMEQ